MAIKAGDKKKVEEALIGKGDLENSVLTETIGWTPLHLASHEGHDEVVE